jgi:hypothetical protein
MTLRRAPLGFGTGPADQLPTVVCVRSSRPFIVERMIVLGNAYPTALKADGKDCMHQSLSHHLSFAEHCGSV